MFDEDRYYTLLKESLPATTLPKKKAFNRQNSPIRETLTLETNKGEKEEFQLEITGWVATFASTRGKKRESDFSPSHLSIISNGKLGEFNIIPSITTDRINEAYVVGQLHINLLEESVLPDISLSNRQGYKSEDIRYKTALELAKKNVLIPILNLKTEATDFKNYAKKHLEQEELKKDKKKFDESIGNLIKIPSFNKIIQEEPLIRSELQTSWNLKNTLNKKYKKIMISHYGENKDIIDEFEKILHFCEIENHEIIYTSSDYEGSRFKPFDDIFDYLKEFFVNTMYYSDLCVAYFINEKFSENWNATLEAGAGWVLEAKAFCFFTDEYESVLEPIKSGAIALPRCSLEMGKISDIQNLANAVIEICKHLNRKRKTKEEIISFIKSTKLSKI